MATQRTIAVKKVIKEPKEPANKEPVKDSAFGIEELEISKEAFVKSFNQHLRRSLARDQYEAADYEKFLAIAYTIRDRLIDRWIKTQQTYYKQNVKRVYYLSLEFLMGRSLGNAALNIDMEKEVTEALSELGMNLEELRDLERDAGLATEAWDVWLPAS